MICPSISPVYGGLLCMMIISVSSGTVYVQSGSDITDCYMKCPEDDSEVTLELYRQCRGEDRTLLENHCYYNHTKSHDSRLRLHTGSGCWKLTPARKEDSCVYKIWCHCDPGHLISSTEIRVLDQVLISNITSTGGRLGEEMAVRVQFSGEESAVTWEVDGEPLPERYRLIDDNRTLIIPSVQRDDAERRFRVRITNPVSEEIREYRLEIRDLTSDYRRFRMLLIVPGVLGVIIGILVSLIWLFPRHTFLPSRYTLPQSFVSYSACPMSHLHLRCLGSRGEAIVPGSPCSHYHALHLLPKLVSASNTTCSIY
ncbi:uncharacterized protein [Aquarana catesbeiana]|uniref:uncharacterized protein isoform X2 n=1 Tax=Aquarana catesbeiana TaxID=8400 RepID=UPI003CCA6355